MAFNVKSQKPKVWLATYYNMLLKQMFSAGKVYILNKDKVQCSTDTH